MAASQAREPLASADAADTMDASALRRAFYIMAICFGLNHACVTTPVGYASSVLGNDVGQATNAVLYFVCMLSALFIGPLADGLLSSKGTMIFGMLCYCVYTVCFGAATGFEKGSDHAWALAIGGAIVGGVGAGTLWTGQGGFFSALSERLAEATGKTMQEVTSELSSIFAVFYLGQECFWKVLFTVMQKYLKVPDFMGFLLYGVLALVATAILAISTDVRRSTSTTAASKCAKAAAAVSLWPDAKIWLISGNNIAFGFAAAYLNGYINGKWQTQALGSGDLIGFLGAVICLIATISSKVYGRISEKMGTKVPIVAFGSLCFLLIGLLSFITAPDGKGPGGWSWGILIFYVLQGLGRGVYESTNKGVFGDVFPGAQGVGAFANCMVQNTFSSTIGFLLGTAGWQKSEVWMVLVFSVLSVPGLMLAQSIQRSELATQKQNNFVTDVAVGA